MKCRLKPGGIKMAVLGSLVKPSKKGQTWEKFQTVFLVSPFVSYCTFHSTKCTQFRKFTQTSFSWSRMNICIVLYSSSVQHSTECTPYTNIKAVHNWTAVCMCSCKQTDKSQIKTQEITASLPRLSKCSDGPGGGQLSACPSARRQGPKAKLLPFTS